jgi:hypothetical protein
MLKFTLYGKEFGQGRLSRSLLPFYPTVAEDTLTGFRVGYGTFMRALTQTELCERTSIGSAGREERERRKRSRGSDAHTILPGRECDPIA